MSSSSCKGRIIGTFYLWVTEYPLSLDIHNRYQYHFHEKYQYQLFIGICLGLGKKNMQENLDRNMKENLKKLWMKIEINFETKLTEIFEW